MPISPKACGNPLRSTSAPLIESLILTRSCDASGDWNLPVLAGFDELRRNLPRQVFGNEGMFAGFDVLDWAECEEPQLSGKTRTVLVTAAVPRPDHRHHDVVYEARRWQEEDSSEGIVARAIGTTISLSCQATSRGEQHRERARHGKLLAFPCSNPARAMTSSNMGWLPSSDRPSTRFPNPRVVPSHDKMRRSQETRALCAEAAASESGTRA